MSTTPTEPTSELAERLLRQDDPTNTDTNPAVYKDELGLVVRLPAPLTFIPPYNPVNPAHVLVAQFLSRTPSYLAARAMLLARPYTLYLDTLQASPRRIIYKGHLPVLEESDVTPAAVTALCRPLSSISVPIAERVFAELADHIPHFTQDSKTKIALSPTLAWDTESCTFLHTTPDHPFQTITPFSV